MVHPRASEWTVPSATRFEMRRLTLEALFALSLFAGTASLHALSTGNPETIATVAFASFVLVVVGLGVLRLLESLGSGETSRLV